MTMTMTTTAPPVSDVRELQDAVAHHVATASERGGVTWELTAPLLADLIAEEYIHAPAVVTARAVGQALARQAAVIEHSRATGDRTALHDIVERLRAAHARLLTA